MNKRYSEIYLYKNIIKREKQIINKQYEQQNNPLNNKEKYYI